MTPGTVSGSVAFIASTKSTPPAWDTIKDNGALRKRELSAGSPLSVYFSITDDYDPSITRPTDKQTISLNAKGADQTEAQYLAQVVPGIMAPGTVYYVHAYQNGAPLGTSGTSPAITTQGYPPAGALREPAAAGAPLAAGPGGQPSLASYLWAMDDWKKAGSDTELQPIEADYAEVNYIPLRISWPSAGPGSSCVQGLGPLILLRVRNTEQINSYWELSSGGISSSAPPYYRIAGQSDYGQKQYADVLFRLPSSAVDGGRVQVQLLRNCDNEAAITLTASLAWDVTPIGVAPPPPPPAFSISMRKGKVGMREFTVDVSSEASETVAFIASKKSRAPEWDAIKGNKALLRTRKLTKGSPRSIYFSITDEYRTPAVPSGNNPVILPSPPVSSYAEISTTTPAAPGIMTSGTEYYVYAYFNGAPLEPTAPLPFIKTLDAPSSPLGAAGIDAPLVKGPGGQPSLMPYLWAMDDWKKAGSDTELEPIEINYAELNLIPFRIVGPINAPNGNCTSFLRPHFTAKFELKLSREGLSGLPYWSRPEYDGTPTSTIQTYSVMGRYGSVAGDVDLLLAFGPNIPEADRSKALTAELAVCPGITTPAGAKLTWPIKSIIE